MKSSLDAVAYWLIDYYIAATVVLIVVALVHRTIREPARRLALHWGALLGLTLLAVLCALPGWPRIDVMHIVRAIPEVFSGAPQTVAGKAPSRIGDLGSRDEAPVSEASGATTSKSKPAAGPLVALSGAQAVERGTTVVTHAAAVAPAVDGPQGLLRTLANRDLRGARLFALTLFAIGCVLTAVRVLHGVWAASSVRRSASQAPPRIIALLKKLAGRDRCPEVLVSRSHPVPVATGTLRPKILLPPQFAERERRDDCRSVLAHELAHIQNGDLWLLALDRWLLPLFWLHPLYLRLRRSFRDDQELLADTFAAGQSSRADYADMLVRWARRLLAEREARQLASAIGVWDRPTRLGDRIARLLHDGPRPELCCPRAWRMGSLLSLIAFPVLLSTATLRPDVPDSSNFVGQVASRLAPVTDVKVSCRRRCCHTPASSNSEDRLRYSQEQPALAAVKQLGGSVKREPVGSKSFVTEVNMVFHYTLDGHRVENRIFTGEALPHIAKFHHLRTLALAGGQITDGGLRQIAGLKELQGLTLRDARLVSSSGIAELMKLPRLRRLELTNAAIGDAEFAQLASIETLEELSVEGSDLSVQSLEAVGKVPALGSLSIDLGDRPIGRDSLLSLQALPNLKRLSLQCSEISDEALLEIKSLRNLRWLGLGNSRVSGEALAALRRSLPKLSVKVARQTLRPHAALSTEQTFDDAPGSEEILSKVREFTRCVGRSKLRAASMMTGCIEEAQYKVFALRIYPSLTNVDWKVAFIDSDAALAVSSEFSNHFGATLAFTCRMRRVGTGWKIEDFGATSVREGVEKTVGRFASTYPHARPTDEWLASPANLL
jgi:beta-lactamase regulating signal transducer with metallopeptidase domain